jgi:hypothetical protein
MVAASSRYFSESGIFRQTEFCMGDGRSMVVRGWVALP